MSETMNIHQRLHAVMQEVKYIQKAEKKEGMKYRAVMHDDVVEKVRPFFVKHGIVMTVSSRGKITREWMSKSKYGNEMHNTLTEADIDITFVNKDDPHDCFTIHSFGIGIDDQDKGPGKAISYAVKYAVLKNLFLETGDDPDGDQGSGSDMKPDNSKSVPKTEKSKVSNLSQGMIDMINKHGQECYGDEWPEYRGKYVSHYNVGSLDDLTTAQLKIVIGNLDKKLAEKDQS